MQLYPTLFKARGCVLLVIAVSKVLIEHYIYMCQYKQHMTIAKLDVYCSLQLDD